MTRFLDIILSLAAFLLISPLFLVIMLILRFTGEREVFYWQTRIGKGRKPFEILKFATMLKASPNLGAGLHTLDNDPRVLPFGRLLRQTKLNEIPQLLNILKGDISIIGPRPTVPSHFEVFPEHVKREIEKVRPGLSGIGSIVFADEQTMLSNSSMDHEKLYANVIVPYKGELELWHVRNQSLYTYFALILSTLLIVINRRSKAYLFFFQNLPKPSKEFLALTKER